VVTVVRGQKYLLPGYVASALLAKILSGYVVKAYGVPGASILYALLMSFTAMMFGVVLLYCTNKKRSVQ